MALTLNRTNNMSSGNLKGLKQPTVFTAETHPTYLADLEKVSKVVPVASFGSLSTLAGSDSDSDATPRLQTLKKNVAPAVEAARAPAAQLVWPVLERTESAVKREIVTLQDRAVKKRAEIVNRLGAGQDYKLARLARLEQRLAAAETIESDDLTALHDYDTDVLGMMWAQQEKKDMQPVIGGRAGGMYIQKIKPHDAWSRLDCDTDISEAMAATDSDNWALPASLIPSNSSNDLASLANADRLVSKASATSAGLKLEPTPVSDAGSILGQFRHSLFKK